MDRFDVSGLAGNRIEKATGLNNKLKVLLFANTDWYLYNFRRSLATALREAGYDVLLVSPAGPYGTKLIEMGFRWIPAPMLRRSLNPLRELGLLLWLRRVLLKERVDLMHGFTIKGVVYGALAARLAGGVARINSVEGMGYVYTSNALKARALRPLVNALLRLAISGQRVRLILLNPDDAVFFAQSGLAHPDQVRLIPGAGVDCQRFCPAEPVHQAKSQLRVLLPARLLWDKGVAEFVEAARLLKASGRTFEFLLAGSPDEGNPAAVPKEMVLTWQSEGLLHWLGHVADMPGLYRSVDVVALPSYREGLPTGLTEASACGLPIITTDAPGCREVVVNGENGFLIPVKNARALADAVAALDDNHELRAQMGANARQRAIEKFDEKIVLKQTLAVYEEVLGEIRIG